ncbi:MAG: BMC domain-containing protein [Pseudomonadota bacterium]|nr:BMC domain-containing protein [Pseudomonadota bacterium]
MSDALSLLELDSIARGYRVLDAMVKESPITIVAANLVEPGKFLILFGGGVAEVDAAFKVGLAVAEETVLDSVFLPGVHPRIWTALAGETTRGDIDTIGVIEAASIAGVIEAADRSIKEANVALLGLRIAPALGGKGFYVVDGQQYDVEAAIEAGTAVLQGRGKLVRAERIARPHPDFLAHLLRPAPFMINQHGGA